MKKQNENTTQNTPPSGSQSVPTVEEGGLTGKSDAFTRSSHVTEAEAEETPEGVTLTQLRAENEQLKETIRMAAAHRQITGELTMAGARSPELLFDSVKADLQFAEDGTVGNVAALVERLKRSFPEQFGYDLPTASIDGGAGRDLIPQLTREALTKMKPAEIAELDWADVKRVLATA